MKRQYASAPMAYLAHTTLSLVSVLLILALAGCSTLSLDSAKQLGSAGQETSAKNIANIFVSDEEYQRAMDAEAFLHGFAGANVPQQLSDDYETIQSELAARKIVFAKLNDVYSEFSKLSSIDAATGMETAINGLGEAVNGYAGAQNKSAVISSLTLSGIAKIGGLAAQEIQKDKLKQSSILIRERLAAFKDLFSDPLVKSQMTTFKKALAQNRASAIQLLWKKGVYDPSPLINQMGAESGLEVNKEAFKIVNDKADSAIRNGLEKVIVAKLNRHIDLIEKGYDASIQSVTELIAKHDELEKGGELNLFMLRQIIAELQRITEVLAPVGPTANK